MLESKTTGIENLLKIHYLVLNVVNFLSDITYGMELWSHEILQLKWNWFFIHIITNILSVFMASLQNSIRHNLSLHNRFMRVQNEGTGKSSWWMLNPDAKPGKSVRRRAASMETSKFEKRRGRVKKRVEQMRNGGIASESVLKYPLPCFNSPHCTSDASGVLNDVNSSPGSSVSEGLDLFPESPLHRYLSSLWHSYTVDCNAYEAAKKVEIGILLDNSINWRLSFD